MQRKLSSFKKIKKRYPSYTTTLISGSFDPFNEYYFKLLRWAARKNRPLIVILQKDNMTLIRRGFTPLSTTHKTRAEIISSLEFVDYVIIANKTAHNQRLIWWLKPKIVALQNDNAAYRKVIAQNIGRVDSKIKVAIAPFRPSGFSKNIRNKVFIPGAPNEITERLLAIAKHGKGTVSKISAILTDEKNRVLTEATNSEKEEHAELLLLKNRKVGRRNISRFTLYILIPPCLMCAKAIQHYRIRKVFYLIP